VKVTVEVQEELPDDRKTDEVLENTLKVAAEMSKMGTYVASTLEAQTEQMLRIDRDLAEINPSLQRSERIIKGMQSWTASVVKSWTSFVPEVPKLFGKSREETKKQDEKRVETKKQDEKRQSIYETKKQDEKRQSKGSKHLEHLTKLAGDRELTASEQEFIRKEASKRDQQDKQLDVLNGILDEVLEKGNGINNELHLQEEILNHVDTQVGDTSKRVDKNNKKIAKLII